MDTPARLVLVQTADWDPLSRPGGFEPFVTALAHGLASSSDVLVVGPGIDRPVYRNSGELFSRQTLDPHSLRRTLASLSEQGWFIAVHNLVGALVEVTGPMSLMLHAPPNMATGLPGRLLNFESPIDLDWSETLTAVKRHGSIAVCSATYAEQSAKVFTTSKFDVVHPPVHPLFGSVLRQDQKHDVLWVGRTVKRKGLDWLLENKEHWTFSWRWSGDEYFGDDSVSEMAKSSPSVPAGRGVIEMASLFSKTRVVLCTYLDEGFGMVVAEAAASGCRVVAFGQGGVLESGRAAHVTLVPPGDVVAFNDAVCVALEAGPVSQEERAQAASLYSPENAVLAYREHLRRRLGAFDLQTLPHSAPTP